MKYIILILFFIIVFPVNASEFEGNASYYSRAGCLGCSPNLIMANGEPLDDTKHTVALPPHIVRKYKLLNQYIGIINLRNYKSVIAKVTDTGGFGKYNRIADLSVATKEAIGCGGICRIYIVL